MSNYDIDTITIAIMLAIAIVFFWFGSVIGYDTAAKEALTGNLHYKVWIQAHF